MYSLSSCPKKILLLSKTLQFNENYSHIGARVFTFQLYIRLFKWLNQRGAIKCKYKFFSREILDSNFP